MDLCETLGDNSDQTTQLRAGRESLGAQVLVQLTEHLYNAESLEAVYDASLRSILDGLQCHRAALLLFDKGGIMRFVAWHGLSDEYRSVTEGHSPWEPDEPNPSPVVIADALEGHFHGPLAASIEKEGIRAICFIPLVTEGRLVGKFMAYFDAPHEFSRDEINLATTIARQLASGIERKRAQADLLASEESLHLALDSGKMGTWTWEVGSDTVKWSPSLEKIFGFEPGTFPGDLASYIDCLHPEDRERVRKQLERNLALSDHHNVEHRVVWPDGSLHWIEGRGRIVRDADGRPIRIVGVSTDVTDRRKAENDIRFLADASAVLAGALHDEETLQTLANLAVPQFADWCKIDLLEAGGTLKRVAVTYCDPEKLEAVMRIPRLYSPDAAGGPSRRLRSEPSWLVKEIQDEFLLEWTSDQEHLATLRSLNLRSFLRVPLALRNKVHGAITFLTGKSGRCYDEEDLKVAEDLAHRAAVALENARLYEELREADRRKDRFLATLAHELRSPLSPMRYAIAILDDPGASENQLKVARETIDRQVAHMVRLVDDLLDVSRISRDKLKLQMSQVEIASVAAQTVEAIRPQLDAKGQILELDLPASPIVLVADATRVAQVLSNLLNNASKFTDQGGTIKLSVRQEWEWAVISVRDTGIGIAPEYLPVVFEMFRQADDSIARSEGGLGIGLSLVKRLVELHNGTISASSEGVGKGSEFVVKLPVHVLAPAPKREDRGRKESIEPRRILVVDDNLDAANMFSAMLTMMGHETQVAYDGEQAVLLAESFRPALVLMDIGLPKLNGYEAARQMRQLPGGRQLFLVAVTGWGQQKDREMSKEAGFDVHLVKPIGQDVVRDILHKLPPA